MEEKLKTFIENNATLDLAQESDAILCFLHYQVPALAVKFIPVTVAFFLLY